MADFFGCALGGDSAVFEDDDAVDAADGCWPVGDDEDCGVAVVVVYECAEALLDECFGFWVGEGRCFVEDEDGCADEERAGDGEALALATGQVGINAVDGVESLGQVADFFCDARLI